MEKLAQQFGVSVTALEKAFDSMSIDLVDYNHSPSDYDGELRSVLGLPGQLATPAPSQSNQASAASTVSKTPGQLTTSTGGAVAKKPRVTKAMKLAAAAETAKATQVNVNRVVDSAMDSAIANVRSLDAGIESFTDEVAAYTAGKVANIPASIAGKTIAMLEEVGESASTGFHSFADRSDARLEALR